MNFKVSKGQYVSKGVKKFDIKILNENNQVEEEMTHTGCQKGAKKKAQRRVDEIERANKELEYLALCS